MTDPNSDSHNHEDTALPGEVTYTVGYSRPPKETQFKPGQSGNPKGRPRGRKNVWHELMDVYTGTVPVIIGGRRLRLTKLAAVFTVLWQRAMKGDERAARAFLTNAKTLGLLEKPAIAESAQDSNLSDEEIEALSDAELEQLIELEEEKERITARVRATRSWPC